MLPTNTEVKKTENKMIFIVLLLCLRQEEFTGRAKDTSG